MQKVESEEERERRRKDYWQERLPGWRLVRTPPSRDWLDALIGWVAGRVQKGGGFDAARVRELFEKHELSEVFETPGEALEFFGVIHNVGVETMLGEEGRDVDLMRCVRVWLKATLGRPDRDRPPGVRRLLRVEGDEVLVEMTQERFRRGWGPSLPIERWIELVPDEVAPELDRDELVKVVNEGGTGAMDKLKSMLAPEPASVVRGLVAAGALDAGVAGVSLRPTWLSNVVEGEAAGRLYGDGPSGLGALLLYDQTVERALVDLAEQVADGEFSMVEQVNNSDTGSPELAAALDGVVRAVGFALASGREVPHELVRGAWEKQSRMLVKRFANWPPIPVLSVKARNHARGETSISAWFLAAFAISKQLSADEASSDDTLDLWGAAGELRDEQAEALTMVSSAFRRDDDDAFLVGLCRSAERMGGDLLQGRGVLRRNGQLLGMQKPHILASLAAGDELELADRDVQEVLRLMFGLDALEEACSRRGITLDQALAWCWDQWGKAEDQFVNSPPVAWFHSSRIPGRDRGLELLWAAAPPEAIPNQTYASLHRWEHVWPYLSEPVWARWIEVWSGQENRWHDSNRVFTAVPAQLALDAVRDGHVDAWCHKIREVLWNRLPDEMLEVVDEMITREQPDPPQFEGHGGPVADLVFSAPDAAEGVLVRKAKGWLEATDSYPGLGPWTWRWLARVVELRCPGWRTAFDLLAEEVRQAGD